MQDCDINGSHYLHNENNHRRCFRNDAVAQTNIIRAHRSGSLIYPATMVILAVNVVQLFNRLRDMLFDAIHFLVRLGPVACMKWTCGPYRNSGCKCARGDNPVVAL